MEKLFLTGQPGIGKSTIIEKLQKKYPTQLVGILAKEIRDNQGTRQGFTSGTLENPQLLIIAHRNFDSNKRVSSYGVNLQSLDALAEQLANQLTIAKEKNLVLVFDEIGLMQSFSTLLRKQIEAVVESDAPAIMTIKQDDSASEWLRNIKQKSGVHLIALTEENREEVLNTLSKYIENNT